MSYVPITPADVTPGTTGSWQDADCSSVIPPTATGVACLFIKGNNTNVWGFRKNGSTDAREYFSDPEDGGSFYVGVDSSQIFEFYLPNTVTSYVYVIGYFEDDAVFITNTSDIEAGVDSTWNDYDISSHTGTDVPIAAILNFRGGGDITFGFRKNGSTDTDTGRCYGHGGFIVGVDGSELLEGWQSSDNPVYLQGYITKGAVMYTNSVDESLGSTGAYVDLTAYPKAKALIIEVEAGTSSNVWYAFRPNGETYDHYVNMRGYTAAIAETDAAGVAEGKIDQTAADFHVQGYFLYDSPPPSIRRSSIRNKVLLAR